MDVKQTKYGNSPEFTAAMTWGATTPVIQSEYQASTEYLNFTPPPIPTDSAVADPMGSDDPSVASTVTPLYYAWELLPPPPPTTTCEQKEKKGSKKITKIAVKPRPKELSFSSAADALNPKVAPALPPKRNSIAPTPVEVEKIVKTVEVVEPEETLPIEKFEGDSPCQFFVTPEEAWKAKPKSESQSSYKWTSGHVATSLTSALKSGKKGKNAMKENDVTSQRVFTFRGARKVLERCKREQKEKAKLPGKKIIEEGKKVLEKGLQRRSSIVELEDKNIIQVEDADAVARRRNSSVELTRMLESRPMFLPDGRTRGKAGSAAVIEKSLAVRPTKQDLIEKNVIKCDAKEAKKVATRRQSVDLIEGVLQKEKVGKENKDKVLTEISKPKKKLKKKKKAVIPKRSYENGNWVTMNNTAHWNYAGGREYLTEKASSRRESKVTHMDSERKTARAKAEEAAKTAPEKYFGNYGRREVWAPRYPKGMGKMDRKTTTYKRDFVWPGYRPTKTVE